MEQIINLAETTLVIDRNEYLKFQGSIDTNIYYVESGSLRIYVLDNSDEQIIRFGYSNDFIVSLDSFITENPSEYFIQAIKKTVVKVIPKKTFFDFISISEKHKNLWPTLLEDLIIQQLEREKDILISSPKERYNRVLKRSPKLFQEIPNKHIANYLRMSPETLSRLKKS